MLLKNALIVAESGELTGDLRCEGELFAELGQGLSPRSGEEVLDLAGKIVLPGGVDVHTHFDLDVGFARATDDFYTGTVAAACGGTTTIVDHMAFGERGFAISSQLEKYHALAKDKAVIDYGFHGVFDHVDDGILNEIGSLIDEGVTSHKFYLTYDGRISDAEAYRLMRAAKRLGVMLCVHPENHGVVELLKRKYIAAGKTSPEYHALSRPPECEAEAINRMIMLSSAAGNSPLYIVHLTCGLGLGFITEARRRGAHVFAETCPQYLLLDDSCYMRPDALKYVMSPPLRKKADNDALWHGLRDGGVQTVGTDHCPFFYSKEKRRGKDDFTKTPNGMPGVEARMALIFSEGVQKNRISLRRMAEICCAAPARLFGLYPQKGAIRIGADADFTVFDPKRRLTLTKSMLHENCDYTPYEGFRLTGWPVLTASRGEIIAKDGVFLGGKGRGRYLRRGLPILT